MGYRTGATHTFTTAQFVRRFAECRRLARNEPVFISSYGRTTHALLAIAQFEGMAQSVKAGANVAVATDLLREWSARTGQPFIICDTHLRVLSINNAACTLFGVIERDGVSMALEQMLSDAMAPKTEEAEPGGAEETALEQEGTSQSQGRSNLLLTLVRRCLYSRQDVSAEIPSPFLKDSWLKLNCFLWQDHLVVTLKDITAEIRLERLADREAALAQAMGLQDGMAAVQLSLRGHIEEAGTGLSQLLGVPQSRLKGTQFLGMVDIHSRAAFRAGMEATLRGEGARKIALKLICNDGGTAGVTACLVQLCGAYGVEGVTMVLNRSALRQESVNRRAG